MYASGWVRGSLFPIIVNFLLWIFLLDSLLFRFCQKARLRRVFHRLGLLTIGNYRYTYRIVLPSSRGFPCQVAVDNFTDYQVFPQGLSSGRVSRMHPQDATYWLSKVVHRVSSIPILLAWKAPRELLRSSEQHLEPRHRLTTPAAAALLCTGRGCWTLIDV